MKRIAILAALVVGLVAALSGNATAANTDCTYNDAAGSQVETGVPQVDAALNNRVEVYTGSGRTEDAIVGVCVNTDEDFDGGYAEVGSGGPGTYAVIDGSEQNPAGQAQGYGGISTYENGTDGHDACSPNVTNAVGNPTGPIADADPVDEGGSGTNGGGCLTLRGGTSSSAAELVSVPLVPLACGSQSGPDWADATRDGCTIP